MDRLHVGLELLALRGGAQLSVFCGLCRKGNRLISLRLLQVVQRRRVQGSFRAALGGPRSV